MATPVVHRAPWDHVFRLRRAGRIEEALAALEADWQHSKQSPSRAGLRLRASLLGELARVARERGEDQPALELLGRALDDAPEFPDLHLQRGLALRALQRAAEAREALQAALERRPGYLEPTLALAMMDAREGRLGEAVAALEELARRRPPAQAEAFRAGLGRLRAGDWEGAEERVRRAWHLRSRALEEKLRLAWRELESDRPLESLRLARELAERSPGFADAHHAVGLACLALDWLDDALEAFGRALAANPGFHEARVYLAWVLFARGDNGAAEHELERVLAAEPGHEGARKLDRRGVLDEAP